MFTCLWQLWDWLDPPLYTTTMESKKLQQLQQANSHLAPIPQTKPPQFQHATGDFNSPVFQNHPQYHSITSNFAQINLTNNPHHGGGGQQHINEKVHQQKPYGGAHQHHSQQMGGQHMNSSGGGYHLQYPAQTQQTPPPQQLQQQQQQQQHYHADQIYQSTNNNRERLYQQAPVRSHPAPSHPHTIPSTTRLQQQYQQLQQEKMQLQMKTQNEAIMQQQQTFALRQQLNPPVPPPHFHMPNQPPVPAHSIPQTQQLQQQQQQQHQQRSIPPSSLNLTNQFQPAQGPLKLNTEQMQLQQQQAAAQAHLLQNQAQSHYGVSQHQHQMINANMMHQKRLQQSQAIYHQNQQIQQQQQIGPHSQMQNNIASPNPTQIIIQQNNPGQVVNQACQTQLSGVKSIRTPSTPEQPSPHQPLERRKSGPIHSIKSPVTKRPAAPVTVAGWLYKQGSEGLKVWRKRWFVLSEYCLFYYKGPEEEKLLGSVLLPSYKISACLPDDKVYRKYAFKCEHTNMRTYWLAADTADSMVQWVRSLTLATMMQGSSESESQPSISSFNHSGENSDSGIHTFQSQQSKISIPQGPVTPASDNGGGAQPLYANAPPKPRRANDGGYSSPSPETSIEKYEPQIDTHRQQHPNVHSQLLRKADTKSPVPQMESIYGSHMPANSAAAMRQSATKSPDPVKAAKMQQMRLSSKSPNVRAQSKSPFPGSEAIQQYPDQPVRQSNQQIYGEREMYLQKMLQQQQQPQQQPHYHPQQAQGQTQSSIYQSPPQLPQHHQQQQQPPQHSQQQPQTRYAPGTMPYNYQNAERRTPDTYGPPRHESDRRFSDYEDIYNLTHAQQNLPNHRGSTGDNGSYQRPMSPTAYNANATLMPTRYTPTHFEPPAAQHVQMRARPAQSMVPRPHSADFLEFEARNPESNRIRPEQTRAPRPKSSLDINRTPDHYYYSEASYAEKMRQSAVYLQKPTTMPAKLRMNQYPDQVPKQEGIPNSASSNTIPRESDYERAQRLGLHDDNNQGGGASSVPRIHRSNMKNVNNQQDQFLRSASARLPRREEENNTFRDGEKKREESMKRLLEWKQRMLQSPLTRKTSPHMSLAQNSLSQPPKLDKILKPVGLQRSRSETNANHGYNSYSSDDEDGTHKSAAGRSTPTSCTMTSANEMEMFDPNPPSSTTTINKEPLTTKPGNFLDTSLLVDHRDTYVPVYKTKIYKNDEMNDETVDHTGEAGEENFKDSENCHKAPLQAVDSIDESDHSEEDDDKTFEYTDDDLDEALLDEMPEESMNMTDQDVNKTPVNALPDPVDVEDLADSSENHYMPMGSKSSKLHLSSSESSIMPIDILNSIQNSADFQDENPYIEMSQGKLSHHDDSKSNYEIVTVLDRKLDPEPVYMELSNLNRHKDEKADPKSTRKNSFRKHSERSSFKRKRNDLPDILKASHNFLKSDSSDADDEASKDFDSADLKSRTRFSLSDTFRPASYYLGASIKLDACIDSSDSEIVSPPPIPKSPPPLEEMNTEEIFSSENYDTVKRKEKQIADSFGQSVHSSNPVLNLAKKDGHRSSRLSLPDQLYKNYNSKNRVSLDSENASLNKLKLEDQSYSGSTYSFNTDDGSNTSSDYDLYNKLKLRSPSFTKDSASNSSLYRALNLSNESEGESVELRYPNRVLSDEDKMKRRPLSEDSFSEIESLDSKFNEKITSDNLDQYLGQLQTSDAYRFSSTPTEQNKWLSESLTKINDIHYIKPPEVFRSDNDSENYYENMILSKMTDNLPPPIFDDINPSEIYQLSGTEIAESEPAHRSQPFFNSSDELSDRSKTPQATNSSHFVDATLSPLKEKNLSLHDAQCASEDMQLMNEQSNLSVHLTNSATLSSIDIDQQSSCTVFDLTKASPIHTRGNSNLSDSAPYYYSDIASRNSSNQDENLTSSRCSLNQPKLNNQRDVNTRRSTGISHIHNPINKRLQIQDLQMPPNVRSISAEILNVTDKDREIERKNLCDNDSGRLDKNFSKNSDSSLVNKNYYQEKFANTVVRSSSSSIEGFLTNNLRSASLSPIIKTNNVPLNKSGPSMSSFQKSGDSSLSHVDNLLYCSSPLQQQQLVPSKILYQEQKHPSNISAGDQLWEEDALWTESLRRVSHRHAKSLDDLDRIGNSSSRSSQRIAEADEKWGVNTTGTLKTPKNKQTKLTRDVTYVNDKISPTNRTNSWMKQNSSTDNNPINENLINTANDDNDVYVQLAIDNDVSDVYEVLREESSDFSNKSFDIDREKIRQWDLMSSGLVKTTTAGSVGSTTKGSLGLNNKHQPEQQQLRGFGNDTTTRRQLDDGSTSSASISVQNVRSIPKNSLTVKPASNEQQHIDINRNQHNQHQQYMLQQKQQMLQQQQQHSVNNNTSLYYPQQNNIQSHENYIKPEVDFETSRDLYAQRNDMQNGISNSNWSVRKSGSQRELNELEKENAFLIRNLDMSAGDLLNRTHEELILLLIQLRRQNSTTARKIEQCCTDIHEIQNRIRTSEGPAKMENLTRLEQLKQQLADLEKQYEKSKPLVNLVDNMVKLGSLYRGAPNNKHQHPNESSTLDRMEFNQRIQERRMMQEEKKQWERLSPNQNELQSKVQQLYQLDQLLQEESGTLQSLQRDKEDLERALSGLRVKLQNENQPPVAVEAARRQQHALERELSQVHLLLAENSKKLEQTVASNARLEQELLVIRQKLQASRDTRGSQSALGATDSIPYGGGATAVLESELRRVQHLVGDMQRQRQELSLAVRQLTENSNSLYQQMNKNGEYSSHIKKRPPSSAWTETDLDSMINSDPSQSITPLYIDTESMNSSSNHLNLSTSSKLSDFDNKKMEYGNHKHQESDGIESSGMESDDLLEGSAFSYLSSQEKQEIKTVRIVKRESERRQRDRERTDRNGFSSQNLDQVLEEEIQHFDNYNNFGRSQSLPRTAYTETHELFHQSSAADITGSDNIKTLPSPNYSSTMTNKYNNYYNTSSSTSINSSNHYPVSMIDRKADLYSDHNFGTATNNGYYTQEIDQKSSTPSSTSNYTNYINHNTSSELAGLKHKTESIQSLTKTIGELSPVFQSEAARQIIIEMSGNTSEENEKVPSASKQRRAVPKEKRRHYTAPHHLTAKSMQAIQAENDMNKNNVNWRARDDLDMEVALRPRINAPDVVRSALGPREKISETTIDKLLAAPSKIIIPERYIPEQPPELSAEEKRRRHDKVEAIKKMLSETPAISANGNDEHTQLPPSQISAEKKQREHLLQLNQILAQQVMQMSKIVAEKAMAILPSKAAEMNKDFCDEDDLSPPEPLPLYQQRDNFFT